MTGSTAVKPARPFLLPLSPTARSKEPSACSAAARTFLLVASARASPIVILKASANGGLTPTPVARESVSSFTKTMPSSLTSSVLLGLEERLMAAPSSGQFPPGSKAFPSATMREMTALRTPRLGSSARRRSRTLFSSSLKASVNRFHREIIFGRSKTPESCLTTVLLLCCNKITRVAPAAFLFKNTFR